MEGAKSVGDNNWKKIGKQTAVVLVGFCIIVTAVVGGLVLSNVNHLGRFAKVWQLVHSQYLDTMSTGQLVDGATKGIVDALGDPYSTYLDVEDNQQLMDQISGKIGGVGIVISLKDPEHLIVLRTIKNTPAARAGILPGDTILKIDNTDVSGMSQSDAVMRMRGEPGTEVNLDIYRENSKSTLSIDLTRENISIPTVEAEALPGYPNIAYVSITQFSVDTGSELKEALNKLDINKYKGIILDLRYNHGGELNASVEVASNFITPGPVVYQVDKQGNVETRQTSGATYLGKPLVVLVNEESASAAEIVAGAIKDKGTGTLIGTTTYGKGVVQTIFPLDGGTSLKLTTAKYLTPNKNDINKKGIEPDIKVELPKGQEPTITPTDTKFDAQLSMAAQTISARIH